MRLPFLFVVGLSLAVWAGSAQAQASPSPRPDTLPRLYKGLDYGSQSYFSPLTVLLNKGYDQFQERGHPRNFWGMPYGNALRNGVVDALIHPVDAIERFGGWGVWIRQEILPLSFSTENAKWFVNYTDHLIMGGLTYRMLDEWFRARGVPHARFWAGATTLASNVINEAVEHPYAKRGAASSVADLYVFDIGAILLFNLDGPYRFFAETLQAADWSTMAAFTFPNEQLQNNGQFMILKIPLPWVARTRLFLRGGLGVQLGLSQRVGDEHSVSIALGADTKIRHVDPQTLEETVEFESGGSIFIDRNNSLLASLALTGAENRYALNVYPGLLPGFLEKVGLWAVYTRSGVLQFGIVHRDLLGLGVGWGR